VAQIAKLLVGFLRLNDSRAALATLSDSSSLMAPPSSRRAALSAALALALASASSSGPGRLLFRTWPYMNPAARESLSFRAIDLGAAPLSVSTLATLPAPPAGETEVSLYAGSSVLDAEAGLWYSSTVVGTGDGFPPGRAVLTVFDVRTNKVVSRVDAAAYCNALAVDRGQLLCEAAAPWYWPPGAPESNDDVADLVESLLLLDVASGNATFLANFTPGFVLSYGSPAFDAASGTMYLHVAQGLSSDIEVWSVDVRATPAPRVVTRASGAKPLETLVVQPGARAGQLLAVAFEKVPAPKNFSLSLFSADVRGSSVALTPIGAGSAYPAISYTGGAAALSGDGALLYVVGTSPTRVPFLVSFDTTTGAVADLLDLSVVCPDDPSPCVVGDLVYSAV
jgi:hypothetical protein